MVLPICLQMTEGGEIGEIQPYMFEPDFIIIQCPKMPSDSWAPTVLTGGSIISWHSTPTVSTEIWKDK